MGLRAGAQRPNRGRFSLLFGLWPAPENQRKIREKSGKNQGENRIDHVFRNGHAIGIDWRGKPAPYAAGGSCRARL
jgi:hypothetical protein